MEVSEPIKLENDQKCELFDCSSQRIKKYKCQSCFFETDFLVDLKQGFKNDHTSQTHTLYACKCDFKTFSQFLFIMHRNKCTTGETKEPAKFKLISRLKRHLPAEKLKWYQCEHCSYKTQNEESVQTHAKFVHTPVDETQWLYCENCFYRTKDKNSLQEHLIVKHTPRQLIDWFWCKLCPYKGKIKAHLRDHVTSKHTPLNKIQWLSCDQCTFKAKYKKNLQTHVERTHAASDKMECLQCPHCSYKATKMINLRRHVNVTHLVLENTYRCEVCSDEALVRPNLHKQVECKHTPLDEIRWLRCDQCSFITKVSSILQRHVKDKHKE